MPDLSGTGRSRSDTVSNVHFDEAGAEAGARREDRRIDRSRFQRLGLLYWYFP